MPLESKFPARTIQRKDFSRNISKHKAAVHATPFGPTVLHKIKLTRLNVEFLWSFPKPKPWKLHSIEGAVGLVKSFEMWFSIFRTTVVGRLGRRSGFWGVPTMLHNISLHIQTSLKGATNIHKDGEKSEIYSNPKQFQKSFLWRQQARGGIGREN